MNAAYLQGLTAQVNAVTTCAELQAATDQVIQALEDQLAAYEEQLIRYAAMALLAEIPTSIGAVISWVSNFINLVVVPMVTPYVKLAVEIEQMIAAINDLKTAIQNKADDLGNCTITIAP